MSLRDWGEKWGHGERGGCKSCIDWLRVSWARRPEEEIYICMYAVFLGHLNPYEMGVLDDRHKSPCFSARPMFYAPYGGDSTILPINSITCSLDHEGCFMGTSNF